MTARFLTSIISALILSACGQHPKIRTAVQKAESTNQYAVSVTADSSMRQVVNKKWSCMHAVGSTAASSLPYRKISILNQSDNQALQVAVHYLADEVPTVDTLTVGKLECFYSSSDTRIVKCFSKEDPTLKIETSLITIEDRQLTLLALKIQGAEKSFEVYLGGRDNRMATLTDFLKRYHDPIQLSLNLPDRCGFED